MKIIKKIAFLLLWIAGTAYLSFQYFRMTDFPIGHDVINHIQRSLLIQNESIIHIFKNEVYPIPALLFIWLYKTLHYFFGWGWPRVFVFAECLYLFLTALFAGIFAWVAFRKWPIAIVASYLVASSRWLNGSLHTGLMGEAFGWSIFVLCLILLLQKKWFWLALAFIFLAFSHPIPFGVMCIFLVAYLVYYSIWQKKYWLLFIGLLSFTAIMAGGYFALPEKRNAIIELLRMRFPTEGEWRREYVIGSDFRRFNQYLFGVLGFWAVWLGKAKMLKETRGPLLLFAALSFVVTFKYLFGIHYLSFRYYTYFEVMNSVFAAFMAWYVADSLKQKSNFIHKKYQGLIYYLILGFLAFVLIWPNTHATYLFTKGDLAENTATTTPIPERTLIAEAAQKTASGKIIVGQRRWVWWFQLYGLTGIYNDGSYDSYDALYAIDPGDLHRFLQSKGYQYVYLSSVDAKKNFEAAKFMKIIYNKENIRVYEVE